MRPLTKLVLLCGLTNSGFAHSQSDVWTQKANFVNNGGRWKAVSFGIGSMGYMGTGEDENGTPKNDFWQYDPTTNVWTQKANVGGSGRYSAVGFALGNKGYIGTGYNNIAVLADFWEYDPIGNAWTQKTTFGGVARSGAVGFVIGNKGYLGTGFDNVDLKNDFWEYDPLADNWTQKANFGGTARYNAIGLAISTKGYLGTGFDGGPTKDFWEYDPVGNTWTQKAELAGTTRSYAACFSIGSKGYIGMGLDNNTGYKNDLWEYDPGGNTWVQKANFSGTARSHTVGFTIGTKGYIGTGINATGPKSDFWEYQPSTSVLVAAKVKLDGPYNSTTGLMNDALGTLPSFPLAEPYTALGYTHVGGGGGETIGSSSVLNITGNNAIVDWVVVELRASANSSTVVATRSALLQRDGDVVSVDGTSPVQFSQPAANYYVAVRHRNHLGAMTLSTVGLSSVPVPVDFAASSTAIYGTAARKSITGTFPTQALWAGDVTFNGQVKYTGTGNDRDPILTTVGSTTPNNALSLYSTRDVNLDGLVKYTGSGNDRDPILVNVGSTTPNNIRVAQLP